MESPAQFSTLPLGQQHRLCWEGIQSRADLRLFFQSDFRILVAEPRWDAVWRSFRVGPLALEEVLEQVQSRARFLFLDLSEIGTSVGGLARSIYATGFPSADLGFVLPALTCTRKNLATLRSYFPAADLECSADFLAQFVDDSTDRLTSALWRFANRGVHRFVVDWFTSNRRRLLEEIRFLGFDARIAGLPDSKAIFTATLQGVCLLSMDGTALVSTTDSRDAFFDFDRRHRTCRPRG